MERTISSASGPEDRLDSWKEIAVYLNRGVRTVQRWEREKALPVRRLPGGDRARVYALRSELDHWWNAGGFRLESEGQSESGPDLPDAGQAPLHPTRMPWPRRAAWFTVALAPLSAALLLWIHPNGLPAGVRPWPLPSGALTGVRKPVPLVSMGGWAGPPALSPDGKNVAFTWQAPDEYSHESNSDRCGIYVQQIGGGPPVRTVPGEDYWGPAWSPDGLQIAAVRGYGVNSSVVLLPARGGPERILCTLDFSRRSRLAWTPDSRWLIASNRRSVSEPYGLWTVSAQSGRSHPILDRPPAPVDTADDTQGDLAQGLSPDGRTLVFSRSLVVGVSELYGLHVTPELQPAGAPWRITAGIHGIFCGAAWTGRNELLYSSLGGPSGLWRVAVSGAASAPEQLSWAAGSPQWPALAPSRRRLLYRSLILSSNLWRLDLRTGQSRMLVASGYGQLAAQYSPDGRRIAFQSDRSGTIEIWTCGADGENCRQLTSFGGPICGVPRWSPDGRRLALDSRAGGKPDVYIMPADGGTPRRLTTGNSQNQVPSWSHDGRWIYFESDRSGQWSIWKMPSDGGAAVQVMQNAAGAAFESADGLDLYFSAPSPTGGPTRSAALYRVPVSGGRVTLVAPVMLDSYSFAVTANGVYFVADPKTINVFDPVAGATRTVARLNKNSVPPSLTVSPDGNFVVFSRSDRSGADLMMIDW